MACKSKVLADQHTIMNVSLSESGLLDDDGYKFFSLPNPVLIHTCRCQGVVVVVVVVVVIIDYL